MRDGLVQTRVRLPLVAGVAASGILHAAGMVALAGLPGPPGAGPASGETLLILPPEAVRTPEPEPVEMEPPPPEPPPVRPGLEDSASDSPAWQGAAEATEHAAPKSVIDQAALTANPGDQGQEAAIEPNPSSEASNMDPGGEAKPMDGPEDRPQPAAPAPAGHEVEHPPERVPGDDPPPGLPEGAEIARFAWPEPVRMVFGPPGPTHDTTATRDRESAKAAGAARGEASDTESDASSTAGAIDYRPGKPLAGKGLKIRTVRPNWTTTTRLTALPRNPMVRVVFARDGRVLEAEFVGPGTGYADVDAPLLHAIRRWTASGKELERLPADQPRAGVTMTFRVILRE